MRVLKFAWHLFWAARRFPYQRLSQLINNANYHQWLWETRGSEDVYYTPDTELTEALRRYGR